LARFQIGMKLPSPPPPRAPCAVRTLEASHELVILGLLFTCNPIMRFGACNASPVFGKRSALSLKKD
jgi:hypothetical protein